MDLLISQALPVVAKTRLRTPAAGDNQSGFTIIETLIVLGIIGLIILMIFLAIPALMRGGRNDRRKEDVSAILEAVSHYELTNSGNFPDAASNFTQYTKLYYYSLPLVAIPPQPTTGIGIGTGGISTANINLDAVWVYNYEVCDAASPGSATNNGAGYNDVVALYAIESASGPAKKCQQL